MKGKCVLKESINFQYDPGGIGHLWVGVLFAGFFLVDDEVFLVDVDVLLVFPPVLLAGVLRLVEGFFLVVEGDALLAGVFFDADGFLLAAGVFPVELADDLEVFFFGALLV